MVGENPRKTQRSPRMTTKMTEINQSNKTVLQHHFEHAVSLLSMQDICMDEYQYGTVILKRKAFNLFPSVVYNYLQ